MKKIVTITLLFLAFTANAAMADGIDRNAALQKAKRFMPDKEFVEGKTLPSARANAPQKHDAFYVFNAKDGDGYVIVSGDDRTTEILGYSKHGYLDTDNLPENLKWWLDSYASQIKALGTSLVPAKHHANTLPSETIAPLIKSAWNQLDPYYRMCPDGNYVDYDEPGYDANNRCVTGCVATAMAQVMYYWKWPETCPALDSYKIGPYTIKALPATTFEWDKMKDTYEWGETGPAADAVAKLMRYCGQSGKMIYYLDGSIGGLSSKELTSVFQYSPNCHEIRRNSYSASRWESVIFDELAAHRPVLYSGYNSHSEGHQFIVDGYDGNGFFHFNWGWGGLADSYYVLSLSDPNADQTLGGSEWVFQYHQEAFVGVKPAEPGEIILPLLDSQINFLTPTTTYTRASTNSDFVGVSLEGSISDINPNVSSHPFEVVIGWGLLQEDDEIIQKLDSTTFNFSYDSWWAYYNTAVSFGAGLADGFYQLHHIYRYAGETEWKICENNYGSQLWAEVKGNSMTVRVPNGEHNFKVNSITTHEPVKDEEVEVTVNVSNIYEEGTVALTVGLWIQKDDSPWKNTMVGYFDEVGYGGTGDIVMSFIPKEAGTYNIKITSGGDDEALGTAMVIVADVDTLSLDGLTYQCIPDYKRAKVVCPKEGINNLEGNVTISPSVTCNGVECKVTAIDDKAFFYGYYITSLTIPEGIKTIGEEAFYNCINIYSLTIPEGVETIDRYALACMDKLTILELPSTLKKIGDGIIRQDHNLEAVVSHIKEPFDISDDTFDDIRWNDVTHDYDWNLPSSATLYVPIGTKAKYEALSGWTWFANIEEGELKEAMVDKLKYSYNTNGTTASVVLDNNYREFKEVTIPASIDIEGKTYRVTEIGSSAFTWCNNLTSLILPEGLEKIGNNAFCGLGISGVTLPNTLKTLGDYVFSYCSQIKTIIIPEGVETIGNYTFAYMDGLTKLELPNSLKKVGGFVIKNCDELTTVVSHILEPFPISDITFGFQKYNSDSQQWDLVSSPATLFVPVGTKAKYEALSGWTRFADIQEDQTGNDISTNEYKPCTDSWYSLQGIKIAKPQKGVYVKNGRKVVLK